MSTDSATVKDAVPKKDSKLSVKGLPYRDVAFERQIEILKAYPVIYASKKQPLSYKDFSGQVGVHPSKVSGCNNFFKEVGLLSESGHGTYVPSEKLIEFSRLVSIDESSAKSLLFEAISSSEAFTKLSNIFKIRSELSQVDLEKALTGAFYATDGHLPEIKKLIEFFAYVGAINSDGSVYRFSTTSGSSASVPVITDPKPSSQSDKKIVNSVVKESSAVTINVNLNVAITNDEDISRIVKLVRKLGSELV